MNPSTMLRAFCDAVEQRNGKAFAELFTEDGVYHDVFYGAFEGRAFPGRKSVLNPHSAPRKSRRNHLIGEKEHS